MSKFLRIPFAKHFSKAFAGYEVRTLLLNPATPIFLGFAWALASLLAFTAGDFFSANQATAAALFTNLPWVFALIIPALTMHTWAEEWRRGTAERLFTLPLPLASLWFTRFVILWGLLGLFLLGTWPFAATLAWLGSPEWGVLAAGYFGCWLLAGVLLAGGLMVSTVSSGYVTAFLGAFALNAALLLAGWNLLVSVLEGYLPPLLVALLRALSLQEHLSRFIQGVIDLRSVLFFTGLIVLFLGLGYAALSLRARQGRGLRAAGLATVSALLLWLLAAAAPLRLDATSEGRYTLSEATVSLLQNLPAPVTLTLYASRSNADIPPSALLLANRTTDIMHQFQAAAPAKVKLVTINPDVSLDAELHAVNEQIEPQELPTKENFYLGLTANLGGRTTVIPLLDPSRLPYLEFDIASLITESSKTARKSIAILSALNLNNPNIRPRYLSELAGFYDLTYLRPGEPVVPDNTDLLVVMHSAFLPQESLYAIDQYLVGGGHVLMLLDPMMRSAQDDSLKTPDRNADALGQDHPADLLRTWGIGYDWSNVVADATRATPIAQQQLGFATYPFWLSLDETNINRKFPFNAFVTRMLLPEAGRIVILRAMPGLSYEGVLQTSANARLVTRAALDSTPAEVLASQLQGKPGVKTLAMMITGRFPSTFVEVPEAVRNYYRDYAPDPANVTWPALKGGSDEPGALLVVADADFPADVYAVTRQEGPEEMGGGQLIPANDNLVFLYNAIQYLVGDGTLLELRGKGLRPRTFTRVEAMLDGLSKKYLVTEQKLAAELFLTGARLKELKAREEEESLVIDAAREKELKAFQSREYALKKQLRAIRQDFRKDVLRLGQWLALFNMVTMPLLTLVAYAVFKVRRRRRAQRAA